MCSDGAVFESDWTPLSTYTFLLKLSNFRGKASKSASVLNRVLVNIVINSNGGDFYVLDTCWEVLFIFFIYESSLYLNIYAIDF